MQALFRNQGGFHVIGSGRDKIEKPDQLAAAAASAQAQDLDGLVVIGGDDSNTNAAVLAEYFLEQGAHAQLPPCMWRPAATIFLLPSPRSFPPHPPVRPQPVGLPSHPCIPTPCPLCLQA